MNFVGLRLMNCPYKFWAGNSITIQRSTLNNPRTDKQGVPTELSGVVCGVLPALPSGMGTHTHGTGLCPCRQVLLT